MLRGYICLREVARDLGLDVSAILRWRSRGRRLPSGEVVRLQAVRLPGGWVTRPEWVDDFLARLTAAYSAVPAPGASYRSPAARQRANAQAERRLAELGIGAEPVGAETA